MKIRDLYAKYDIMPQLAEHQLRVGGIGKIITDGWTDKALAQECVLACLVHDMGNLVKFRELQEPHWIDIQKRYRERYSTTDAHVATKGILLDAGLTKYADYIEEEAQLYQSTPTETAQFEKASKPAVLVLYADLRVKPEGVVSIQERTQDLIKRYANKRTEMIYGPPTEKYVQSLTSIRVDTLTENDVQPLFAELLDYDI